MTGEGGKSHPTIFMCSAGCPTFRFETWDFHDCMHLWVFISFFLLVTRFLISVINCHIMKPCP
jgi:hypothetical protein